MEKGPESEPFCGGRESSRLLFDFSIMISCLSEVDENIVLDVGAGSCWVSEFLCRMGFRVTALDISPDVLDIGKRRAARDSRIDSKRISFVQGDGHQLPFQDSTFTDVCVYDAFHHMKDYRKVLGEFYRVLKPGGRAIFVEPGSEHSKSKETLDFIERYKKDDQNWIERDIVLEEIFQLARDVGFSQMTVKPFLFPSLVSYSYHDWKHFAMNEQGQQNYVRYLVEFNNAKRVIFYLEKAPR